MRYSATVDGLIAKPSSSSSIASGTDSKMIKIRKNTPHGRGNAIVLANSIPNTPENPITEKESGQLFNSIALVAGTTVGAGILALPAVAIESGQFRKVLTHILIFYYCR